MRSLLLPTLLAALSCLAATAPAHAGDTARGAEPAAEPSAGPVAVVTRKDPATSGPAAPDREETAGEETARPETRSRLPSGTSGAVVVRNGQSYHVKAGQVIESLVVTWGSVRVDGEVTGDVVVILGDIRIEGTVGGDVVNVGSGVELGEAAEVGGDVVGVGGGVERADGAQIGGGLVNVGVAALPAPMRAAAQTTLRECLLKARPLSFAVGWVWWVWGGLLAVHLLLAALFPGALHACVQAMGERPLATTLLSLLAIPLVPLVLTLLLATGVGVLAVPFLLAALLCAAVLGKDAVLVQLGSRLLRVGGIRTVPPAAAFATGLVLVTALYLVPVVGLLTWMVLGLWALGGAFAALIRRDLRPVARGPGILAGESAPPARPFHPDGASGVTDSPVTGSPANPAAGSGPAPAIPGALPVSAGVDAEPAPETAGADPSRVPPPGTVVTPREPGPSWRRRDPVADLALPRAPFWPRAGALILDWLPLLLLVGILPEGPEPMRKLLRVFLGMAYYAWFLTWRGTTPGGLIFRLRVIRTDGRPLDRSTALVRSAGAVLSLLALGLGWLWPLWDPDRQTWHDRLAGTVVVRDHDPAPLV